jgi:hypothetical protein
LHLIEYAPADLWVFVLDCRLESRKRELAKLALWKMLQARQILQGADKLLLIRLSEVPNNTRIDVKAYLFT